MGSTAARLKLKGIDGDSHKRWSVWFNSTTSEEPYQGLTCQRNPPETADPFTRGGGTGAAWLSSARVLRCSVQSGNERNPCCLLQVSGRTALARGRKVGTTSNQHGPLMP